MCCQGQALGASRRQQLRAGRSIFLSQNKPESQGVKRPVCSPLAPTPGCDSGALQKEGRQGHLKKTLRTAQMLRRRGGHLKK
ncbi:unnamed protein product [Caretta caretta]